MDTLASKTDQLRFFVSGKSWVVSFILKCIFSVTQQRYSAVGQSRLCPVKPTHFVLLSGVLLDRSSCNLSCIRFYGLKTCRRHPNPRNLFTKFFQVSQSPREGLLFKGVTGVPPIEFLADFGGLPNFFKHFQKILEYT